MQRAIILAFLAVRAFGSHCNAGYKHKADLTGLTCNTASTDAASCSNTCCEKNTKKCGGLTVTCASDSYQAGSNAWKNTAATKDTTATKCCTSKATCGGASYTCPAGYEQNIGTNALKAVKCPGDAASCGVGTACCKLSDKKCGGATAVANGGVTVTRCNTVPNVPNAYNIMGTIEADDAWKNTPIAGTQTVAEQQAACCGLLPTCASSLYSCPAGQKKRAAAVPPTPCTTATAGATALSTCAAPCCENDVKTCEGLKLAGTAPACVSHHYYPATNPAWQARATKAGDQNTNCCATKATCKVAVCGAGFKKKLNVDMLSCTSDRASCSDTNTGGICCEKDTTKCGGLTGIMCPYGFFDESATWTSKTKAAVKNAWKNRTATDATKNTDCCTPKAICVVEGTTTPAVGAVTTTPAAIVTTTPAAPARLFSEHKVAVEQGSPQGANMLWLGVGGLIGMGVLMVVQGLRSRMQEGYGEVRSSQ